MQNSVFQFSAADFHSIKLEVYPYFGVSLGKSIRFLETIVMVSYAVSVLSGLCSLSSI